MHVRAALRNGLTARRDRRGAAPVRRLLRRAGRELGAFAIAQRTLESVAAEEGGR